MAPLGSRTTVIVGLGATGRSVAHHLSLHGIECTAVDSRVCPPAEAAIRAELPGLPLVTGDGCPELLANAVELVLSPGVALSEPAVRAAVANGVPVLGDIELFARVARAPVAAITGSNGKSTVTTLLGDMARRAGRSVGVGGNLGPPALELLPFPSWIHADGSDGASSVSEPDLYVLELSSFQLETTYSLAPSVAAFLNVSADHMDRYEDFDAYVRAKMRVFNGARKAVISREDKVVGTACSGLGPHLDVVRFGTGVPELGDFGVSVYDEEPWLCRGEASGLQWLLPVREVPLAGAHNVANVLAALALADALEIAIEPALDAIREFRALSHRCEIVSRGAGRVWVNDSKGTNVGATAAAVSGLSGEGPVVLIAGGDGKGADFGPLGEAVAGRVRAAVLLGRDADRIASEIEPHVPCHFVVTMDEAVETAYAHSLPGDVIALSPACASWDMYPNYQARGEEFAALVRAFVTREDAA